MIRVFLLVLMAFLSVHASAAESMSPRMAQRVLMLLDRAEENPEQALASLQELIDTRPENSSDRGYILYERAALLLQHDQAEIAREEIAAALAGQEDDYVPRLRFLLGQLHLMANEPEAALTQLTIWAEQVASPRPAELAILAYTNLQLEHFDAAATVLERAIADSEEPQNQWLELLAFSYTRLNRSDEALVLIERIIAEEPGNARWWRQLASIYLLLENVPKGAAGLAISSVVEEIGFSDAKNLATLFNILGMPADGAEVLETTFRSNPEAVNFEDRMLLGELWMLAREFEFAVREFERAALIDERGEANWRLGQLYLQRENYLEAETALSASIEGYAEEVPAQLYYLLAIVAVNLENFATANTALMRIDSDAAYADRVEQLRAYIGRAIAQQQGESQAQ